MALSLECNIFWRLNFRSTLKKTQTKTSYSKIAFQTISTSSDLFNVTVLVSKPPSTFSHEGREEEEEDDDDDDAVTDGRCSRSPHFLSHAEELFFRCSPDQEALTRSQ